LAGKNVGIGHVAHINVRHVEVDDCRDFPCHEVSYIRDGCAYRFAMRGTQYLARIDHHRSLAANMTTTA
jgi:hypothetical protein